MTLATLSSTVASADAAATTPHTEPKLSRVLWKPRVLIVQRILPHYRVPLFQELSRSHSMTVDVAYGRQRDGAALESVDHAEGIRTIPLRNSYLTVAGAERAVYQRGLSDVILSQSYDVVIAEFNPRIVSNLFAYRSARRADTSFIWWGHGMGPAAGRVTARARLALARAADAVIFYDDVQAARFVALGLPSDHAFVAPNSIDTAAISALAQPPESGLRDRILYVGRLVPEKKVDLLIRAFALARTSFTHPQKLTIVGDGPERPALKVLADSLGVTADVEFTGPIYDQDRLAPLFNASRMSVSPGAVGLAAVHSLAYGVPLILADGEPHGPEASALKSGHNALFFTAGQADSLAAALVAVQRDKQRWLSMAHAARETADRGFGLDRMTGAFERAVEHVTRRARRRSLADG
ncbi:MAG: glycosyltransferase family 4 protein [Gemmatimonadaceae bacterium]